MDRVGMVKAREALIAAVARAKHRHNHWDALEATLNPEEVQNTIEWIREMGVPVKTLLDVDKVRYGIAGQVGDPVFFCRKCMRYV